jgi:hypothetical protein
LLKSPGRDQIEKPADLACRVQLLISTQPPFGMDEQVLNEEYIAAAG